MEGDEPDRELEERFERGVECVRTIYANLAPAQQRTLFALFKQARHGPARVPRTAVDFDAESAQRLEAWLALGNMSMREAMQRYVALVDTLVASSPANSAPSPSLSSSGRSSVSSGSSNDEVTLRAQTRALQSSVRVLAASATHQGARLSRVRDTVRALTTAREESAQTRGDKTTQREAEAEFHALTATARTVEAALSQHALEARMRQSHARRQLSEEMLAKQLEESEERVAALSRTQRSLADVSRLGLLAHPRFPLGVLLLLGVLVVVKLRAVHRYLVLMITRLLGLLHSRT